MWRSTQKRNAQWMKIIQKSLISQFCERSELPSFTLNFCAKNHRNWKWDLLGDFQPLCFTLASHSGWKLPEKVSFHTVVLLWIFAQKSSKLEKWDFLSDFHPLCKICLFEWFSKLENVEKILPKRASRKTTQTEHRKVHQSKRSLQGKNGPGEGMHWMPGRGVTKPPALGM